MAEVAGGDLMPSTGEAENGNKENTLRRTSDLNQKYNSESDLPFNRVGHFLFSTNMTA